MQPQSFSQTMEPPSVYQSPVAPSMVSVDVPLGSSRIQLPEGASRPGHPAEDEQSQQRIAEIEQLEAMESQQWTYQHAAGKGQFGQAAVSEADGRAYQQQQSKGPNEGVQYPQQGPTYTVPAGLGYQAVGRVYSGGASQQQQQGWQREHSGAGVYYPPAQPSSSPQPYSMGPGGQVEQDVPRYRAGDQGQGGRSHGSYGAPMGAGWQEEVGYGGMAGREADQQREAAYQQAVASSRVLVDKLDKATATLQECLSQAGQYLSNDSQPQPPVVTRSSTGGVDLKLGTIPGKVSPRLKGPGAGGYLPWEGEVYGHIKEGMLGAKPILATQIQAWVSNQIEPGSVAATAFDKAVTALAPELAAVMAGQPVPGTLPSLRSSGPIQQQAEWEDGPAYGHARLLEAQREQRQQDDFVASYAKGTRAATAASAAGASGYYLRDLGSLVAEYRVEWDAAGHVVNDHFRYACRLLYLLRLQCGGATTEEVEQFKATKQGRGLKCSGAGETIEEWANRVQVLAKGLGLGTDYSCQEGRNYEEQAIAQHFVKGLADPGLKADVGRNLGTQNPASQTLQEAKRLALNLYDYGQSLKLRELQDQLTLSPQGPPRPQWYRRQQQPRVQASAAAAGWDWNQVEEEEAYYGYEADRGQQWEQQFTAAAVRGGPPLGAQLAGKAPQPASPVAAARAQGPLPGPLPGCDWGTNTPQQLQAWAREFGVDFIRPCDPTVCGRGSTGHASPCNFTNPRIAAIRNPTWQPAGEPAYSVWRKYRQEDGLPDPGDKPDDGGAGRGRGGGGQQWGGRGQRGQRQPWGRGGPVGVQTGSLHAWVLSRQLQPGSSADTGHPGQASTVAASMELYPCDCSACLAATSAAVQTRSSRTVRFEDAEEAQEQAPQPSASTASPSAVGHQQQQEDARVLLVQLPMQPGLHKDLINELVRRQAKGAPVIVAAAAPLSFQQLPGAATARPGIAFEPTPQEISSPAVVCPLKLPRDQDILDEWERRNAAARLKALEQATAAPVATAAAAVQPGPAAGAEAGAGAGAALAAAAGVSVPEAAAATARAVAAPTPSSAQQLAAAQPSGISTSNHISPAKQQAKLEGRTGLCYLANHSRSQGVGLRLARAKGAVGKLVKVFLLDQGSHLLILSAQWCEENEVSWSKLVGLDVHLASGDTDPRPIGITEPIEVVFAEGTPYERVVPAHGVVMLNCAKLFDGCMGINVLGAVGGKTDSWTEQLEYYPQLPDTSVVHNLPMRVLIQPKMDIVDTQEAGVKQAIMAASAAVAACPQLAACVHAVVAGVTQQHDSGGETLEGREHTAQQQPTLQQQGQEREEYAEPQQLPDSWADALEEWQEDVKQQNMLQIQPQQKQGQAGSSGAQGWDGDDWEDAEEEWQPHPAAQQAAPPKLAPLKPTFCPPQHWVEAAAAAAKAAQQQEVQQWPQHRVKAKLQYVAGGVSVMLRVVMVDQGGRVLDRPRSRAVVRRNRKLRQRAHRNRRSKAVRAAVGEAAVRQAARAAQLANIAAAAAATATTTAEATAASQAAAAAVTVANSVVTNSPQPTQAMVRQISARAGLALDSTTAAMRALEAQAHYSVGVSLRVTRKGRVVVALSIAAASTPATSTAAQPAPGSRAQRGQRGSSVSQLQLCSCQGAVLGVMLGVLGMILLLWQVGPTLTALQQLLAVLGLQWWAGWPLARVCSGWLASLGQLAAAPVLQWGYDHAARAKMRRRYRQATKDLPVVTARAQFRCNAARGLLLGLLVGSAIAGAAAVQQACQEGSQLMQHVPQVSRETSLLLETLTQPALQQRAGSRFPNRQ